MKEFFYYADEKIPLQRREGVFAITVKDITSPLDLTTRLALQMQLAPYGTVDEIKITDGTYKPILTAKDKTITVPQLREGISFDNIPSIASAYNLDNGTHIYFYNTINVSFMHFNKKSAAEELEQIIDTYGLVFSEKSKFTPQGVNHYHLIVPKADDNKALLIANDIQESGIADSFPCFTVEIKVSDDY